VKLIDLYESEQITASQLRAVEVYADKLFKELGIDIAFTKHFVDRVNDPRNGKQITVQELGALFRDAMSKAGAKIAKMNKGAEAVIIDMESDINLPFILKWDDSNQELDLVAKTVMRKKGFMTRTKKFHV